MVSDQRLQSAFQNATDSPGLALWRVTNAWQRAIRAALAPHDLTHVQFVLLACLSWMDSDRPVTQRELAEHAGINVMMTSQVIRTLETKGYVACAPHPADRRAVSLAPTAAGVALANLANADVEATDAAYFDALGPEDMALFSTCLRLLDRRGE